MGKKAKEPRISEVTEDDNLVSVAEKLNIFLDGRLEWKIDSDSLVKALLNFHFHLFVMKQEDEVIGMGILYIRHMLFCNIAHLDYIYIHDEYKIERNLWDKLLGRMIEKVRGRDVDYVELLEKTGSSVAKEALLEMGFNRIGERSFTMRLK